MSSQRIKVSIAETADGTYRLMTTSAAGTNPAGPRLERGQSAEVDWEHFDRDAANEDAEKLQAYIDAHAKERQKRGRGV